jgi:hypothetical protein
VPGMRPGGPHMPNYFVPVVQQGQQGPRPGIRRSGAGDQGQQPAQSFQQQVFFYRISCCYTDYTYGMAMTVGYSGPAFYCSFSTMPPFS